MAEIDIKALTKDAEDGRGCVIKNKLQELSFDEVTEALKKVKEQNSLNRQTDSDLPTLRVFEIESKKADSTLLSMSGKYFFSSSKDLFRAFEAQAKPGKTANDHYDKCLNADTSETQEDPPKPSVEEKDRYRHRNKGMSAADQINLGYGAIPPISIFVY